MLVIRQAQIDALVAAIVDPRLVEEIEQFLRHKRPCAVRGRSGAELRELADLAVKRCRALGMQDKASFCWYALVALEVSPHFEQQPEIGATLRDPAVPPDQRIAALWDRTDESHWEDARRTPPPC